MKKTKALQSTFISLGVLFAVGRLLGAGTSEGVLNSGNMRRRTFSPAGSSPLPNPQTTIQSTLRGKERKEEHL